MEEALRALFGLYWNISQPVSSKRSSELLQQIENHCRELLTKDYEIIEIHNDELCLTYPPKIFIPWKEISCPECSQAQSLSQEELEEAFTLSSIGRARGRFISPAILCHYHLPTKQQPNRSHRANFIMRSGALIQQPELSWRKLSGSLPRHKIRSESFQDLSKLAKIREADKFAMKKLGVNFVCDLMVEVDLVILGVLNCVSSEKGNHGGIYDEFQLVSVPYPGFELFSKMTNFCKRLKPKSSGEDYRTAFPQAVENVKYDWSARCTTDLNLHSHLSENNLCQHLEVPWQEYQSWNIVTLTQNYLKGILSLCLAPVDNPAGPFEERGILIHCISGWDRTPLFVSLLRISLWADGVIHKSLSAIELLFFTVATDWMLFGHNLNKRVGQAAELMFYCFYLLTFIKSDEYSIDFAAGNPVNPTRGEKLEELSQLGLEYYSAVAAPK